MDKNLLKKLEEKAKGFDLKVIKKPREDKFALIDVRRLVLRDGEGFSLTVKDVCQILKYFRLKIWDNCYIRIGKRRRLLTGKQGDKKEDIKIYRCKSGIRELYLYY